MLKSESPATDKNSLIREINARILRLYVEPEPTPEQRERIINKIKQLANKLEKYDGGKEWISKHLKRLA